MRKKLHGIVISISILVFIMGCAYRGELTSELGNAVNINQIISRDLDGDHKEKKNNKYEVAGIHDGEKFEKTFFRIKDLVERDAQEELAEYIYYPLRVNIRGERKTIKDKEDFIENYSHIITEKVKEALLKQKVENLFVNYQGVMVGNGEIWFGYREKAKEKYVIIAINNEKR